MNNIIVSQSPSINVTDTVKYHNDKNTFNLDDKNNIIGVDYTMLRFINLTDISTDQDFSIEDYALELDNIYYSLFSDTLSRNCNLYDTLLTTNSYDNADLTYLKRYSCTYS